MTDLRTALHHLIFVTGAHRGTLQMYERGPDEFTVSIDIPDNQLVTMDISPFLQECGKRLMMTNPDALVECRDYQPLTIHGGPGTAPQRIHRLFVRVRENY
jgi:hypothetical protein